MRRFATVLKPALCAAAVVVFAAGCPNARVFLHVTPDALDFGSEIEELLIFVSKSAVGGSIPPIIVSSSSPAFVILDCKSAEDGCTSGGPLDVVPVRVRVDRSLLELGKNSATLSVKAQGLVTKNVAVRAETQVIPDFTASSRAPLTNEPVQFTDTSRAGAGWTILNRTWNFGNGRGSDAQNPEPQFYPNPGSYPVSLTVTAAKGFETATVTALKPNFIVVTGRAAPTAEFEVSSTAPLVNNPVQFTDRSMPGTSPITAWEWNFGDGKISSEQNPSHVYTGPGTFTVKLTVFSADGFDDNEKQNLISVVVIAPRADFTVESATIPVGQPLQFTDRSDDGSAPIESWLWNFGDTGISTERNPIHVYTEPGTYTVRLTVTTDHGSNTLVRENLVSAFTIAPKADFSADDRSPLLGEVVQFMDRSDPGTAAITEWFWEFGEDGVSNDRHPVHVFTGTGLYEVKLTVKTKHGENTLVRSDFIAVTEETALDRYVEKSDSTYNYNKIATLSPAAGVTGHVIDLMSQTWRNASEVDNPGWNHWLTILEPSPVLRKTALLVITGGVNSDAAPTQVDSRLVSIARNTNSVVAILQQIPNQPIVFTGNPQARNTEDAVIATSFRQFLDSYDMGAPDEEWPILLPMTKSAVRAMDTVQSFLNADRVSNKVVIDDFILTGHGNRAWTVWLAAAVDDRVVGMAPRAFEGINFTPHYQHHRQTYGFFSEAIYDYVEQGVLDRVGDDAFEALAAIVDPYVYAPRYTAIAKLLISSSGDQYYPPDSPRFYLNELPGETKLAYIANTDHDLDDQGGGPGAADPIHEVVFDVLFPWYLAMLNGGESALPAVQWSIDDTGLLLVTPDRTPSRARLWRSSSRNRDFRFDNEVNAFGAPNWIATVLSPNLSGQVFFRAVAPPGGWDSYFIELEFDSGFEIQGQPRPFVFSTDVRILPDTFPAQIFLPPTASFTLDIQNPEVGQDVQFTDTSNPGSGPVIRWTWTFGDGQSSTDENPVHAYAAPGSYTVSLSVATVHGTSTANRPNIVTVSPAEP